MKFNLEAITTSRFAVSFTLWVGRTLPLKVSYWLVNRLAKVFANRSGTPMVQAVRANQWIIRGEQSTPDELDQAVKDVFQHAGRCFADLYHAMQSPERIMNMVMVSDSCKALIQNSQKNEQGAFLAAPHVSNFDLALLALAHYGLEAQVLTYGQPTGGYQIQNDLRASTGMDITPVGEDTHNIAIERMKNGGLVATAIDRPIRRKAHTLSFFGHPSPLPAGHVRMALEADVPVIPIAVHMRSDGKYFVDTSDPIPMVAHENHDDTIRLNAEAVLKALEKFIRPNPGQWLMYYPAWSAYLESISYEL
ncbi:MAG: lysophospholipid acyltransferase family protein [Chloroflexota bacterium]